MQIVPTDNRVVVQKLRFEEDTTKSGIILTTKQKENSNQGKVLEIGKNVKYVSVDNKVVYSTNVGVEIHLDAEHYVILKEDDILAIIK